MAIIHKAPAAQAPVLPTFAPDSPQQTKHELRSAVKASFIGTFIEWFDYAAYVYMSAVVASVFFPNLAGRTALIFTFGLFALSFLVRPIGAVVWGHIGDRFGRIRTLSTSIVLMSGATFCIGLLPGHATIGAAAPLLLLACRMVQGFSAAGEYAGASTHLAEVAPTGKRGLFGAVVPSATASGLLLGSLIAAMLTGLLDDSALHSWGWRVPFLLAAPLGIYGLMIRRSASESAQFSASETPKKAPIVEVFRYPRALVVAFAGAVLNAIGFYVILTYLPTYLSEELGMNSTSAFISSSIASAFYVMYSLMTGHLSDRLGRRTTMLAAAAAMLIGIVPAFILLDTSGFLVIVTVQVCLGGILALNDGVLPSFLSEQFPTSTRLTGFALTFNCANAIFGGTAPMIATWLIGATGSVLAPAYYLAAAAVVTGIAVAFAAKTNELADERD
ncbi:MFS transporter [Corynebacterium vitaeruminis]|uniref:Major facilitator superfamily permease n=1 Tax=Corynebacterium vitaeruminis DSM 20294 TaxID=1224164 RepID=W5Y4R6_9CORY|nr:MFS transporter [Corynebacterium vitaeruminis]AHI21473.1 major facilitator superfamily permease [Corynebacterium vitaeruminis DSM 20294]